MTITRPASPSGGAVAVEQLPEGRGENAFGIQDRQAHGVEVRDLSGVLVHAHLSDDPPCHHTEGHQGAADYIEVLCQTAERHVHILIGLAEHIHGHPVMPVVLVEIDGFLWEGLVAAVVVLDARLVNDDFGVLDHVKANVLLGVEAVGPGDGDIAVDVNPALEISAVQQEPCHPVLVVPAEADENVFMKGPFCQMGGKGGLAGAGNAEIDVEHVGMPGTEEGVEKKRQVNKCQQKQQSHTSLLIISAGA